jgi:Fe-S-cluster containining protein
MEAAYMKLQDSWFLDGWDDGEVDALVSQFAAFPCPALGDDGHCRVYESRPVTCRMMGIPIAGAEGETQGACEIQNSIPIRPLSHALRADAERLAEEEAASIEEVCHQRSKGTELLLPYGFLPARPATALDGASRRTRSDRRA